MSLIKDEISKIIKEYSLNVELFNEDAYRHVIKNVVAKFISNNGTYPLWDHMVDKYSLRNANAWRFVTEFAGDGTVLFLEQEDARLAVKFFQIDHLRILLENSFHFVFYLTDLSFTYLLCFNDHDYLIGCGSAKEWVAGLDDSPENPQN